MNLAVKIVNSITYYRQFKGDMQLLAYFENEISDQARLRNSVRRFIIVRRLIGSPSARVGEKIDLVYQTMNYTRPQGLSYDASYQLSAIFTHYKVAIY